MNIETLVVGPFQCNCRILSDPKSNEAIIIDPGDEPEAILEYVNRQGLKIKALLHTHGHLDHVLATAGVKAATQAPVYLHKGDLPLYENLRKQCELFGLDAGEGPVPVDHFLEHEMDITLGTKKLKTIFTPGHSPGSCCFYVEGKAPMVFSGDTLFLKSIGRTDLWGGNSDQIAKSIKQRLYTLDGDTLVLAGHGPDSSIAYEKRNNPFVSS
ncbi:MAG: MBL fold metallo-hydrolase [Bdellovibrionia bacterium]